MCTPWTFNAVARAVTDTSTFGMYNVQMNLMQETLLTNQSLFLMPNPLCSGGYPIMNNYTFRLPDPKEWASQIWAQRPAWLQTPQFTFGAVNGAGAAGGTGTTAATNPKEKEYQDIKGVLQEILNQKVFATNSEEEKAINEALTTTGDVDKRLSAVKAALEKVGKNPDAKRAIATAALSNRDIKIALYDLGYNFTSGIYNVANDLGGDYKTNDKLVTDAQTAKDELDNWHSGTGLSAVTAMVGEGSNTNADIISNLTYLNRVTAEDGGFIKALTRKYKEDVDSHDWTNNEKETWRKAMAGAYNSLRQKALSINKETLGSDLKTKFEAALQDFQDKYTVVKKGTKTDENIDNYVNSFNKVYKMIKMIQAKKIDNDITAKYGYLNNTSAGIVPENVVIDETKRMIEAECIGDVDDIDVSSVTGNPSGTVTNGGTVTPSNAAEAKVQALTGLLSKVTGTDPQVYETTNNSTNATPKSFYVIQGEKLVELKDAISYNNGSFEMKDGSTKSLSDLVKANKNNADVDEQAIRKSVNFRKKIEGYINTSHKLQEVAAEGSNKEVILSDDAGTSTFVIIGDELFEIENVDTDQIERATTVEFANGKAKLDSTEYNLKKVTDWSVINNL